MIKGYLIDPNTKDIIQVVEVKNIQCKLSPQKEERKMPNKLKELFNSNNQYQEEYEAY